MILRSLLIILITQASAFSDEPRFWVSGKMVSEVGGRSEMRSFSVSVSGKSYHIKVLFPEKSSIPSLEVFYDGTNMLSSSKLKDSVNNDAVATVDGDFIPTSSLSAFVGEVWLAFASFRYFETNKSEMVRPVWYLGPSRAAKRTTIYKAKVSLESQAPYLPASIDFFSDGLIPPVRDEQQGQERRWPEPYSAGFLTAEYRVQQVTNIGTYKLPRNFTFERYEPRPDKNREFKLKSLSRRIFWVESGGTNAELPKITDLYGKRTLLSEWKTDGTSEHRDQRLINAPKAP